VKVLSLFDGMSSGRIALEKVGIPIDVYYASEIEEKSIVITQKNYPDTIQLGDVRDVNEEVLNSIGEIDLLIGGSPCRNLSKTIRSNKYAEQGIVGESMLFYEYVRILDYIKPRHFLFENVASMSEEDKETITGYLGVEPIMIDSALFSAQERKRYYWTNIEVDELPEDKGLVLKDIMEDNVPEKFFYKIPFEFYGLEHKIVARLELFNYDMLQRVYNPNSKAPTLIACRGGHKQKKVYDNGRCRKLTPLEYERLQTVPDNYTYGVANGHRYNMLGDGWTVDVIAFILKNLKE
jgi:site-specific DNA-cytosine methylase